MSALRLIADDLTGALDAAMAFASQAAPVPVFWTAPEAEVASSLAIDSGTRDLDAPSARRSVANLVAHLPSVADALFFSKLDSLLRGHAAHEISGWLDAMALERCVIAPAFPHYGRVTRGGIQMHRAPEGDRPVGARLAEDLAALGHNVRLCRPGDGVPDGISLWDAESDADLARLAQAGLAAGGTTLWCGSGGLALALAGARPHASGQSGAIDPARLPRPLLGLFGTDHPVTRAQIAACGETAMALADGGPASAAAVSARLVRDGRASVFLDLPGDTARRDAAERIAAGFARLAHGLTPPGTLVVSGGETLRALCLALGAERLDLYGAFETGVPCSILRGGPFDGVHVVSKSGAFGDPLLLRRLMFPSEGERA